MGRIILGVPNNEALIAKAWLNGRLRYTPNPDGTGESVGYFDNGMVWFRSPVLNGEIHGLVRVWYANGTLADEGYYFKGVAHGSFRRWYPSGVLSLEEHYSRGELHGVRKKWYRMAPDASPQLKVQSVHANGRLHGPFMAWYRDGKLKMEAHFTEGRNHDVEKFYNSDGTLRYKKIYVRGVRMPVRKYERFLEGKLPAKDILAIPNVAVRRIMVEEIGYARILAEMPHKKIDQEGPQELVRIDWNKREEPIVLVKVKCPSTSAFYTLRVPPHMVKVKAAVAWTFDVKTDEYAPSKET